MNNSVKIILAVVTFVACAALGYLVVPSNNPKSNTVEIDETGTDDGNNKPGGEPVPNEGNDENSDKTTTDGDDSVDEPKTDSVEIVNDPKEPEQVDPLPEPVQSVETTPEIKSVVVGQRDSRNYKKIGLAFIAKAVVASGDKLRYELYEIGETTAKYTSDNGSFKEVYPVDGGKYLLKVVNAKTGDFAERQVSGFNKIDKYTSAKLQDVLNGEYDKHFYFHFDTEKLRFDCEGIDSSIVPTSLNALLSDRSGHGWTYVVVGTPLYDKYNRITYFKVRITE